MALMREPNDTVFQKTLAVSDYLFRLRRLGLSARPDPDVRDIARRDQIRGEALPGWLEWLPKMPFEEMARHSMDFWLSSEDLPRPENRIFYDGDRVMLDITEGNMEAHHRLKKKLEHMMSRAGAHPVLLERRLYLGKDIPIGGTAHQAGTARFGTDPASSVLDLDCKAHELDNLYLADASFFPSIGAVNPDLDHHRQRLARRRSHRRAARRADASRREHAAMMWLNLVAVPLIARICLVVLFPFSAADKIVHWNAAMKQATSSSVPAGAARRMLAVAIVVEMLTPICIVIGWHDRLAAFILAGFCVVDRGPLSPVLEVPRLLDARHRGQCPFLGVSQEFRPGRRLAAGGDRPATRAGLRRGGAPVDLRPVQRHAGAAALIQEPPCRRPDSLLAPLGRRRRREPSGPLRARQLRTEGRRRRRRRNGTTSSRAARRRWYSPSSRSAGSASGTRTRRRNGSCRCRAAGGSKRWTAPASRWGRASCRSARTRAARRTRTAARATARARSAISRRC